MREIIHEHDTTGERYAEVFARLKTLDPTARFALVRFSPEPSDPWGWLSGVVHDVEGALRSFRYLAEKVAGMYDQSDPRGQKVRESIDRHLSTFEALKTDLIEPLHRDRSDDP